MYAWEFAYEKIIQKYRRKELVNEAKNSSFNAIYWAVLVTGVGIVLFIILATYVALGNELTSAKAFTGVSLVYSTLNVAVGRPSIGFSFLMTIGAAC